MKLVNVAMNDGSRQFIALPERWPPNLLRDHLLRLPGVAVTACLTDGVVEAWIEFVYKGFAFAINNQLGEYWFLAEDPGCPEPILLEIAEHCTGFPEEPSAL